MSFHEPIPAPDEIERLIFHMPSVASLAENEWAADFARSIVRQAKRHGWQPSPKQIGIMRRLVSELFAYGGNMGGDFDVFDAD